MKKINTRSISADVEKEQKILIGMIINDQFLEGIQPFIKTYLVHTSGVKLIIQWCLEHLKSYGKAPGSQYMWEILEEKQHGIPQTEYEFCTSLIDRLDLENVKEFDAEFELKMAEKYISNRRLELLKKEIKQLEDVNGCNEILKKYVEELKSTKQQTLPNKVFTAMELMTMEVEEIRWVIDGVIPEGLTIFAGKPKVGKSYFLMNAMLDLAAGADAFGSIPTESSEVLYLAGESTVQLVVNEMQKILGGNQSAPGNLHVSPMGNWPRMHEGGMDALERWMEEHPDTRLIVIDTLERFKKPQKAPGYHYSEDYQNIAPLQEFAGKYHIGVIVVHHTKKTATADPFDEITGTVGLTAASDSIAKLDRMKTGKEGRIFAYRGRGIGEGELTFKYNGSRYSLVEDEAERYQGSEQRQTIIKYLNEYQVRHEEPIKRKDLVRELENRGVGKGVDILLNKMAQSGDIQKIGFGQYACRSYEDNGWRHEITLKILQRSRARRAAKLARA